MVDELTVTDEPSPVLRRPVRIDAERDVVQPADHGDETDDPQRIGHDDRECAASASVDHTRAVPEGLEVELYRRTARVRSDDVVARVVVDESLAPPDFADAFAGHAFTSADRVGKLLLLGTDGPIVGLHFGMTGRLVLDGMAPIERLEYGESGATSARWDRLRVELTDGGVLRVNDPRRWARFSIDPDVAPLGPDLFDVTRAELAAVLRSPTDGVEGGAARSARDRRARQHARRRAVVALPGSTLGGSPTPSPSARSGDCYAAMIEHLPAMLERGGSHTGVLSPDVRASRPPCPRDGRPLQRRPGRRAHDGVVRLPSEVTCHTQSSRRCPTSRIPHSNLGVALVAVGDPAATARCTRRSCSSWRSGSR